MSDKKREDYLSFSQEENEYGIKKRESCLASIFPTGFKKEMIKTLKLAIPVILIQISQMILGPVSLIFCGHLKDSTELDGAALGISMINVTVISVGTGLGTACDTFFSQTFGSQNKKLLGVYLQRALLLFTLSIIPILAIHINMTSILYAFGQEADVAILAGRYLLLFIPGAICFFWYIVLAKYVASQNIIIPNVIIGVIVNGVNALMHYLLLYKWNWGTDGSAISQAISYILFFILTLLFIIVSGIYKNTWNGFTKEAFFHWGEFVRLMIPGMLMMCVEWWAFEIGIFLTGLLSKADLGAQSVVLNIDSMWFQIPLGLQIACSIRVGQYLGAKKPLNAKTTSRVAMTIVVLASGIMAIIFVTLRYKLPYIFTNVDEVVSIVSDLLPIVAIYLFFDGMAIVCKGVMYGTGRQMIGAVLLFCNYYLFSLPLGIPLMFLTNLRGAGYWWSLAANLVIQSTILFFIIQFTDWDKQVERAQVRAGLTVKTSENEKTHLIDSASMRKRERKGSSVTAPSGRTFLSATLSYRDIAVDDNMTPDETKPEISAIIFYRIVTLLIVLSIFASGLFVRLLINQPKWPSKDINIYETNVTSSQPFIITNITSISFLNDLIK